MPLMPLVTAGIETALNLCIKESDEAQQRLTRLKGKVIRVHLKELNHALTFVFSQQIDVLAAYEGEPDCDLSLSLAVLPELKDQSNITRLIKQDKLELEGDIQLAQSLAKLLDEAKPNLEEWLSKATGDAFAHTAVYSAKQVGQFVQQRAQRHQQHIAEVLTEEWRIAPPPLEVAHFCDQVDDVKSQAARIEARLNALLESL
ncbi:ubiquinone biosynthesis accessory factor UbiJ [Vibrio astriarenae]|jgi:ubiquinone biosynthesis protein UbiJ|uniref:ubiquinone biosynthesis accessory factor UbiJ n=1 Tax=Vibrio agarivorans TaxID=153622 RepID=UPI0022323763|nr:SCP2 domain-containing protein [Vibrio agarivorans]